MGVNHSVFDELRDFFACEHVVPVGSGTAGLHLALRSIGVRGRAVVLPALTAPSVPLAILAAGGVPRAVDVSPSDCNIDPKAVGAALDSDVAAVIAVDSFGYPAQVAELRSIASRTGCPIIEDACQAYGGRVDGAAVGTLGDVGVVSFDFAKNVRLRAGGLVLTDDAGLARDVRHLQRAPDYGWLGHVRSHVMFRLMLRRRWAWVLLLSRYLGLLRHAFPSSEEHRLEESWHIFQAEREETIGNLERVATLIAGHEGVQPFAYTIEGWLPWRYSFTIPDADAFTHFVATMAAADVPVTHLYPVLESPFAEIPASECPNARRIAATIVNLKYPARAADTQELAGRLERARGGDALPRR